MKYLFLSLCLIPAVILAKNPVEHRQQLIIESQIIEIKDILKDYQPIIDHHDYENIMYHLYVIEVLLH